MLQFIMSAKALLLNNEIILSISLQKCMCIYMTVIVQAWDSSAPFEQGAPTLVLKSNENTKKNSKYLCCTYNL